MSIPLLLVEEAGGAFPDRSSQFLRYVLVSLSGTVDLRTGSINKRLQAQFPQFIIGRWASDFDYDPPVLFCSRGQPLRMHFEIEDILRGFGYVDSQRVVPEASVCQKPLQSPSDAFRASDFPRRNGKTTSTGAGIPWVVPDGM